MTDHGIQAEWIAIDWAADRIKGWAMQGSTVLDQASVAPMPQASVAETFATLTAHWDGGSGKVKVVSCGAAPGQTGGLSKVPCPATGAAPNPVKSGAGFDTFAIPGLRQDKPFDAIWGAETRIAGFLSLNPDWDGVICLPGDITCWALISANEVVSFQTFMTGQLVHLLRNAPAFANRPVRDDWNNNVFVEALNDSMSRPERLAARLSELRAQVVLEPDAALAMHAHLTGLLLGAELSAARPYWLGQQLAVIGRDDLAAPYADALETQGVPVTKTDADRATLAGLVGAWRLIS